MSFKSVFERNPICILDKRHRRENWESSNGLFDWLKQMLLDFRLVETFFENIKAFRSYDKFNTTTWKNGSMRVRPLVVLYSIFFIFFFRTHLAPVVLIIYWQRALSIIEFSLFNIHNNLLLMHINRPEKGKIRGSIARDMCRISTEVLKTFYLCLLLFKNLV